MTNPRPLADRIAAYLKKNGANAAPQIAAALGANRTTVANTLKKMATDNQAEIVANDGRTSRWNVKRSKVEAASDPTHPVTVTMEATPVTDTQTDYDPTADFATDSDAASAPVDDDPAEPAPRSELDDFVDDTRAELRANGDPSGEEIPDTPPAATGPTGPRKTYPGTDLPGMIVSHLESVYPAEVGPGELRQVFGGRACIDACKRLAGTGLIVLATEKPAKYKALAVTKRDAAKRKVTKATDAAKATKDKERADKVAATKAAKATKSTADKPAES